MLMVFAAAPAFAQEECEGLYNQFLAKYKGKTIDEQKAAIGIGEQFISKCNSEDLKPNKDFVEKQVKKLREIVNSGETIACFNNAVKDPKTVNADNAYRCGKDIIAANPDLIDVPLVLATIGFDRVTAATPNDTFNAQAIDYAKQAISKMEAGKTSDQYGAYAYIYKTKEYPDGKSNALAWMNYTIGYIMYNRQNMKKEAIPYLYKSMQYTSAVKKNPIVYQSIGDWYKDEYNRLDDERAKLAEQAKDKTPEEAKALADKAKELLLLQKGYADRMIDAYGRAYNLAGTDAAYKAGLYTNLKVLYAFRYDNKPTTPLDSYISTLSGKPMPDPSSTVTPVVDTTTTTTTATTPTTSSLTSTPTTTTNNNTRPTTDANTTKAKTATTTTKTPVKTTPAPKKKGTR